MRERIFSAWCDLVVRAPRAVLAGVLSRGYETLLFGIETLDTFTFVGAAMLMVLVGAVAAYLPAKRVLGVDPMVAFRED